MSIIFVSLAIIVLLYFVGYGITKLLLPDILKEHEFWLTPWIGTIFFTSLLVIFSLMGISINISAYLIILLSFICLFACWLLKIKITPYFNWENEWFILVIVIISILFNLLSLLKHGIVTTVSFGNLDPIHYSLVADYLIDNSIFTKINDNQLYPAMPVIKHITQIVERWGSYVIISFFSVLLNLKAYQVYTILTVVFNALIPPLVLVLAKKVYPITKIQSFIILILSAFNINLLYILYHAFFGQIIFEGILILLITLTITYISSNMATKGINKFDILIGCGVSSLTSIYAEGTAFIILPVILYTIIQLIIKRSISNIFYKIFKVAILTMIINPIAVYMGLKTTLAQLGSIAGWNMNRFANPYETLGLYNVHYFPALPYPVAIILSSIVVSVGLYGLYKIKNKLIYCSMLSFYLCIIFWVGFIKNYNYGYYKALTFTLFVFIIIFSIGYSELLGKIKSNIMRISCIVLLLSLVMISAISLNLAMIKSHLVVDQSLISLSEVNGDKKVKDIIYLLEKDLWRQAWVVYFLKDKRLKLSPTQSSYFPGNAYPSIDENDLVLSYKENNFIRKVNYQRVLWQKESATLGVFDTGYIYKDNWWEPEINGLAYRWMNQDGSIEITSAKDQEKNIYLSMFSYLKPRNMEVSVNNKLMGIRQIQVNLTNIEVPIKLSKGKNIIKIHSVEKPDRPENDNRFLSLAITNIAIN
ncbi:MAG: hypothetical protein WA118_07865 [Carboxydocellales bacterium]